ncbi:hypothetical protein LZ32DRAFT_645407 [Colletotrichum eremochloae]|nr:hypothetical protein LZ32DRAFT_645407 [Colletotrichum eremochloae]
MEPSFSTSHEPSADTWPPLWDWIPSSSTFECWHQQADQRWMMHCIGPPGSGKTTLSALAIKKLKDTYSSNEAAVASVFIRADVSSSSAITFVEDLLYSILQQLCVNHIELDAKEEYRLYLNTKQRNGPDDLRMQLLRSALDLCLSKLIRAFLIVDDFDRCGMAAGLLLENELSRMAAQGLKVFLTSRIPWLTVIPRRVTCDSCPKDGKEIIVYWQCKSCGEGGAGPDTAHVLCQSCKDKGKACGKCDSPANFAQPFDYIEVNMCYNNLFQGFIDWDLEREHGDLGLNTCSDKQNLPPPSDLGRVLTEAQNQKDLYDLRRRIYDHAEDNVTLARFRLDNIHQIQSIDAVRAPVADVLPANIVNFFNEGMRHIDDQPEEQRELGLKVIAAVTNFGFEPSLGNELVDVILQNSVKAQARQQTNGTQLESLTSTTAVAEGGAEATKSYSSQQRLKEMLYATRGFVVIEPEVEYPMKAYCETFYTYVTENYEKSLMWARENLEFGVVEFDEYGFGILAEPGGQHDFEAPLNCQAGDEEKEHRASASER